MPGTAAYDMRTQDAVPDELEIIQEGSGSRLSPRAEQQAHSTSPGGLPIPKTVVEKVDPASPSHGDVPGTAAHAIRKADAVPDAILTATGHQKTSGSESGDDNITPQTPIPRTVVTRVDSGPTHGEAPGNNAFTIRQGDAEPDIVEKRGHVTSKLHSPCSVPSSEPMTRSEIPTNPMSRSKPPAPKQVKPPLAGVSPIAADGGFGPMVDEESEDEIATTDDDGARDEADSHAGEGFGDDFDDFEAGAENEEFGDFDDGFQQASESNEEDEKIERPPSLIQTLPPSTSPFVSKSMKFSSLFLFIPLAVHVVRLKLLMMTCFQAPSRF